jgi:hypothetical protein
LRVGQAEDKRFAEYVARKEEGMAQEGNIESATETYEGFVAVMKWGTIASLIAGAIVVLLISS